MGKIQKLNHVDAMRGIAILMVILVHTSQKVHFESGALHLLCAYGQMGVQLFFVASAFTLCNSSTIRSGEVNGTVNYFIRRFFRVAPLYYVGILFYGAISILENVYKSGAIIPADQYTYANILSNIFFIHGFNPQANNNIVPGGWSIGTEFAFYAVFPPLFLVLDKTVKSLRCGALWVILIWAICLASIYSSYAIFGKEIHNNNFIYFNLINQLPVFVLGMAFFKLWQHDLWPIIQKTSNFLGFCFFSIVSMVLFHWGANWTFAIIPVISGLSFVFLFQFLKGDCLINNVIIRRIGRVSYSMYLFHFVFAHKLSSVLSPHMKNYIPGAVALVLLYAGSVVATFGVAVISERYIEKPFINLGRNVVIAIASLVQPSVPPDGLAAASRRQGRV